jgi:farnesyl-diphosphate farnesyltransferase
MAHVVARTAGPDDAAWQRWRERVASGETLTAQDEWAFCEVALTRVSRTFAVNIRVLPGELRRAVLLAYLFCRIVDTVEDDASLASDAKIDRINRFAAAFPVADPSAWTAFADGLAPLEADSDDGFLAHHAAIVFRRFREIPERYRRAIEPWVVEMAGGMAQTVRLGLSDTPGAGGKWVTLGTVQELERYCYFVAGTVGHLLTGSFLAYGSLSDARTAQLRANAERFGLGLQLTNIIKDIHDDAQRHVRYLPDDLLLHHGVPVDGLLDPAHRAGATAAVNHLIAIAAGCLDDALAYTLSLPRRWHRVRLFCLWPLLFAIRTLALCQDNPALLTGAHKVKITRDDVRRVIRRTSLGAWSNRWCRREYAQWREKIRSISAAARDAAVTGVVA